MLLFLRITPCLSLVLFSTGLGGCSPNPVPPAELLAEAESALAQDEFDRAEKLAARIPVSSQEWVRGRTIAGEAATKAGRLGHALEYYNSLASRADQAEDAAAGHFYAAEIHRERGELSKAEQSYRAVLALQPQNAATHERLAFLLSAAGRGWDAVPHYSMLLRSGTATVTELIMLADPDRPFDQRAFLEECAAQAPEDRLVRLGLAAYAFRVGRFEEAETGLRAVLKDAPGLVSGQAMLGELLVDRSPREFLQWHQDLPAGAEQDPDIWYVRGLWLYRQRELRASARCFWEAVRRAPIHRRATYQLGQVLTALDEAAGSEFARRASLLIRLTQTLDDILRTPLRREASFRRTTELLEQMGRVWEACGWSLAARQEYPGSRWPEDVFDRLTGMLDDDLPLTTDSANLALQQNLSNWPDHTAPFARHASATLAIASRSRPDVPDIQDLAGKEAPDRRSAVSSIRFVDRASEAGVDFVFQNGPDPATRGARMFEQNGGGVAVLDFDADHWPDLYFSQGSEWKTGFHAPTRSDGYADRLYRKSGDAFIDVTQEARLGDQDYSQGAAAGDFNNDGFPDLYVANIGRNRLYRNNGDGTFSDVTEEAGLSATDWTASCVVADINADGAPDLFDVNYLQGSDLYRMICQGRACSPTVFPGAPDRLHVSRGDGTFALVDVDTPVEHSKGLGAVAADVQGEGRLSLLVANDQVPNFLLRNYPLDEFPGVRLVDEGVLSGFAYGEEGIAMAGMGIAADDVDGNGLIDFLVTNFAEESNTLYLQELPGQFVDGSGPAGLRAPSWPLVGWGAQFLDADLDGEPDLVVANGHVDDYRDEGGQYHMRPQFLRNTGGARFVELDAAEAGLYFGRKYLGRGLARLDWNRDGRMDFAVSNIGDPAALVANESTSVGRFLNVRLQGTQAARDAIGTIVEVAAAGRRWTKQLVAGDGYMASNERMLQFGLGDVDSVTELRVRWPSGASVTLRDLPRDATVQIVEGAPRAIVFHGADSALLAVP